MSGRGERMERVTFQVEGDGDGGLLAVSNDDRLCAHAADLEQLREKLDRLVSAVFGSQAAVVAVTHGTASVGRVPAPGRRLGPLPAHRTPLRATGADPK